MRKTVPALFVVALVPALIVLPVLTPGRVQPHAVAPHVISAPLSGVDAAALASLQAANTSSTSSPTGSVARAVRRPAVLTPELSTAAYQLIGLTWSGKASAASTAGFSASVRIRPAGQPWGAWEPLSVSDIGPDLGSVDAKQGRDGTEPLVTGPSDGIQVRVDTATGLAPSDLRLELVDPGTSSADAQIGAADPASSAVAGVTQPTIVSRAQWGADESLRNGFAGYSDTIKVGFVHHTVSSNAYTGTAGAAAQIRAIYAYDTKGLGWSDIAYNFLVDKYGTLYEGRAGGITLPVIGAHTAGFNNQSFAVAALGCFDTTCSGGLRPAAAMTTSIARVMAWKLGLSYREPQSNAVLTSSGITGTNLHHPAGQLVTTPTISGHRDVDATACPGNLLYPSLPTIRAQAEAFLAVGLVGPALSAGSGGYQAAGPTISSGVIATQTWAGVVTDICRGGTVGNLPTGTATRTAPVSTGWNGKTSGGAWVPPGPYRLTLTSASTTKGTALPWNAVYSVGAPPPAAAVPGSSITGDGGFVAVPPVRILDTRTGVYATGANGRIDLKVLGKGGIPASGVTSVFLTVTATCATAPSYVRVYAGGTGAPPTSNLNFAGGQTRAALVAAPVGTDGTISIGTSAGVQQVLVDVLGYGAASAGAGAELTPVPLTRIYDTRTPGNGRLAGGEARTLSLPSIAGVPASSITSVVANLTVYTPSAGGYLAVYPGGTTWPGTSTLNYPGGPTMDTSVVVQVVGGKLVLRNVGPAVDAAIDVIGINTAHAVKSGGRFTAIAAGRVLDTRTTGGPLPAGYTRAVTVAGGSTGVPLGVSAVLVNLTGVTPTASTSLIGWPYDGTTAQPGGAFLRVAASDVRANVAVIAVAANGRILINNAMGNTNVLVDVLGYYQ